MTLWEDNTAVQLFREYLRIPSVHPDVDYDGCVEFLKQQACALDLPIQVVQVAPRKPVVIITWEGEDPALPSIMLNSHMDVVPVYEDCWTYPPFEAHVTEDGWIYARGSQDMKIVGILHLEAVRRLKEAGVRLKRTVHVTFVPDEEIGSVQGMRLFVETKEFEDLNVGLSLDESVPAQPGMGFITMFHGERTTWQIKVTCPGEPGHGSFLPSNTAGEKLHYIIDKFMKFRSEERSKVESGAWLGDVTTVNLTQVEGGVQANVLPESLSAVFDIRLATDVDQSEFENMVESWCIEAGEDVACLSIQRNPSIDNTKIDDSNPFWVALEKTTGDMGIPVRSFICPGATDARFVRSKGIPSLGFTPVLETPLLLHAHDERVHVDQFLKGIDIMQNVLEAIANV